VNSSFFFSLSQFYDRGLPKDRMSVTCRDLDAKILSLTSATSIEWEFSVVVNFVVGIAMLWCALIFFFVVFFLIFVF